jgi:hypothetical protein
MVETNIRLVEYGNDLYLDVRRVRVQLSDSSPDLREKVCQHLQTKYGLPAVPSYADNAELLVVDSKPLDHLALERKDWRAEMSDIGCRRLRFADENERSLMARLFERGLLIRLGNRKDMWKYDSPRVWYEAQPIQVKDDISVVRRFHVSVIPIEDAGIGVAVHISTAYFSDYSVADFFDPNLSRDEYDRRQQRFNALRQRQNGRKGTLMYDLRRSHHVCFFEEFRPGTTCATTGPVPVEGTTYESLYAYYQANQSYARIAPDDPVGYVSFKGLDRPKPVAANRLYLRVGNSALPTSLKQSDKIRPQERAQAANEFWGKMGGKLLGQNIATMFWQPPAGKTTIISLPALKFGKNAELPSPKENSVDEFRAHFNNRLGFLFEHGCYHVPPAVERNIVVAYPQKLDGDVVDTFADQMVERLNKWTGKQFNAETLPYAGVRNAIEQLNSRNPGMVVIVFENETPETYYLLSVELKKWRIKRVTTAQLLARYRQQAFVTMNALDVLQQLECIPWIPAKPLNYQAQLAIDVGVDRRYFALSLLVCRPGNQQPVFWFDSLDCPKPDYRKETIERDILRDKIIELCSRLRYRKLDPIESMLVLRDGRKSGDEGEAIRDAQAELSRDTIRILSPNAKLDVVDFHKRSLKEVRLWESNGKVLKNVLEGTALQLDRRTVVMSLTGIATLHQGTASPIVLVATDQTIEMSAVTYDVFAAAQLNYSSPRVAQRLPLLMSRTDEILEVRREQEIRGLV